MKISVIIPAFNEETVIGTTLADLRENHDPDEIIVADGGSTDRTREIAASLARVISAPKGRASQLNAGAREASGDIFLFLHADTRLPAGGIETARGLIASGKSEAGRFRMGFDSEDFLLKFYAFHTRFHFFSYGDQAFFVKRGLFERLKGFSGTAPFEDIEFYKRLRKLARPYIIKTPVITSARRFLKVGKLRQKWINLVLVALYYFGVDVMPLKEKGYQDIR